MQASEQAVSWVLRVAWAGLPFTVGPVIEAGLDAAGGQAPMAGGAAAWTLWTVVLVATLVSHPGSLTALRIAAPAALTAAAAGAAAAAAADTADGRSSALALTWAVVLVTIAFSGEVGLVHVNGPAYPNERRFPLRPPGPVLLGPLPLAWAVTVIGPGSGGLLLATGSLVGLPILLVSAVAAWFLVRAMHRLSRRWLVFVPAGIVLHDHLALADPVLLLKRVVRSVGPAPAETTALDLTLGAPGLALELILREETELGRIRRGRELGEDLRDTAVLVSPSRPGAVLREAAQRRLRAD